ncbi:MAG: hypothetical protein LBV12_12820 [Puniceicoccales bacterium]|jgi:lipoate-protein ligase A|nr:hypothetical protein [Puniceicoccales bacterium]
MLHHLANDSAGAAENMALDLLLLENYPDNAVARFRHYTWNEPAFTFGLSQNWQQTWATTPAQCALIRRPTGGGVVSHLDDWTYTVIIPFAHRLCQAHATESYKVIHQALTEALHRQNIPAELVPCPGNNCATDEPKPPAHKPGICFVAPEIFDVVRPCDGQKIAGAAQKRNRHGLLVQGSIAKAVTGTNTDWQKFELDFATLLADILKCKTTAQPMPVFEKALFSETVARFSSKAWNERH